MGLSYSLSNALSGLTASARMAETVSSNLANAMTEGYAPRETVLSARAVGGRGAGVRVEAVVRQLDRALLADRRRADAGLSADRATSTALSRLEARLGAIGEADSLPGRIDALNTALISASADPGSDLRLSNVLTALDGLNGALNDGTAAISEMRAEADADIAAQVADLNQGLSRVERLNTDIARARGTGSDPAALIDQRQVVIDGLSEIVPLREMARPAGQVALISAQGVMLIDGRAAEFGFTPTQLITPEMSFAGGALSGLTRNGEPVARSEADGFGRMGGGGLGAAFALRDTILPEAQAGLDALARDLIARFETAAADPGRGAGQAGLLTEAGGTLDPGSGAGLAGRIAVNAAVDPARGGALWRLRGGVGATAPGLAGEAAQIGRWLDALAAPSLLDGGGSSAGAATHGARFAARIGADRLGAEEVLGFAQSRRDSLRAAELEGGVDSDQQMQRLLRIEESYAANARVMQVVQSMIHRLMEI
ncbi:MAG: flagellar hook-associated protein FlgK [Limimaricola soesokkakensis]|uniref:flagellar hook-associated protein FlgK n=1 Tax=Limimaricola soesokkakensis TaxID=1343159 RepID=UPI00405933FE